MYLIIINTIFLSDNILNHKTTKVQLFLCVKNVIELTNYIRCLNLMINKGIKYFTFLIIFIPRFIIWLCELELAWKSDLQPHDHSSQLMWRTLNSPFSDSWFTSALRHNLELVWDPLNNLNFILKRKDDKDSQCTLGSFSKMSNRSAQVWFVSQAWFPLNSVT